MLDLSQKNGTRNARQDKRRRCGGQQRPADATEDDPAVDRVAHLRVAAGLDKLGVRGRGGEGREVRPEIARAEANLVRADERQSKPQHGRRDPSRTGPRRSEDSAGSGEAQKARHSEPGQENALQDDPAFATRTEGGKAGHGRGS